MSFDFSSLLWVVFAIIVLQPLLVGRWYAVQRAQALRAIEKLHGARVITMIHRQERRSLFGFAVSRHIDLEDAQTIIAAIKDTPSDMPIDLVIHTPGGLVLAAMQIARAVEAHQAKVTVYVPVYAMSGGTLIALAADEIVLGEFSVLGPIDPQIAGLPAASIVKAHVERSVRISRTALSCLLHLKGYGAYRAGATFGIVRSPSTRSLTSLWFLLTSRRRPSHRSSKEP